MGVEGDDKSGSPLTNYVYAPHWYEIVVLLTKSFSNWKFYLFVQFCNPFLWYPS